MTDSSEAEVPPQSNGISDGLEDEDRAKIRPVEIDADVKEMERRKRVEIIMNSRMFREELERIIETQLKEGSGTTGLMQQISDMMGVNKQGGNVFKNSNCVTPINDIRGIEAMGYDKGEKILRCKLASVFRLIDLFGWTQNTNSLVTARLNQDEEHFLVNPYGMMFHEMTASSLIKVGMLGNVIEQGTTNFSVNISAFSLHAAVHAARPDIKCIINVHTPSVVAISALKHGILPLSQESVVIGEVSTHTYLGGSLDPEEKDKLARNLGPNNKVLLLSNQGALCCGETLEEAFFNARNTVLACESQLKLIPAGIDNLILLNDEIKKKIYNAAHKPPESSPRPDQPSILEGKVERKWRVGGMEFEALMRMLDNAGFRTGYIYRHPLVKGDPPRPKNDVEVPPAVSSLGYLLEEEELYRQGLWRKLEGGKKGHDRSRWLNSPNVYQKVEILETGTPDPKKITKWVAEGSPTHSSTPVKIDSALQFVPKGTNPKEFKQKQQQIKDYRRADKISAGPQSHILEGVTWEEARKMQDATVTQTGDQVVLMGAASKGIIQRGHQHNAMVYKSPYAKNPFDSVTDEELDEYKKVVEKKVKGDYDTDFSESEGLSSAQLNKREHLRSPTSVTSETEEESRDEPQVLRIETKQAPIPSQPEVVLSDADTSTTEQFLRAERGSVNSYKSVRVMARRRLTTPYYRNNSHAGLPQGSYLIPNPQHFHIVRHTQIAKPTRPVLIKIGPHTRAPHYIFNRFNFRRNAQTVTINIGNIRSVSLGMSMQTVADFIYPFANALNLLRVPNSTNQSSQTSFLIENPPQAQSCDDPVPASSSPNFEKEILKKLQDNLMSDLTRSESDSDLDFEPSRLTEFDEGGGCEAMADASGIPENLKLSDDEEKSNTSKRNLLESFSSSESQKVSSFSSLSADEGIGDLTKSSTSPRKELEFDENVEKFGNFIFDHIVEQGFENSDLLILPEIYDAQTAKFLNGLTQLYSKLYENGLTDEAKNDLRAKACSYVLNLIENDDRINSSADSLNSQMVSDKVFGISESLNVIMDRFFEMISSNRDEIRATSEILESNVPEVTETTQIISSITESSQIAPNIRESKQDSTEINIHRVLPTGSESSQFASQKPENIHHSTPDTTKNYEIIEEITSFKKDESKKSGVETYWFSVGSPVKIPNQSPPPERKIINVDDIPLKPPKDLWFDANRSLSPIPEEIQRNLMHDFQEESETDAVSNVDVFAGGDSEKIDDILMGRCSDDYVAFDKPETNVVVSSEVTFFRTLTTNTSAYVKADSVSFNKINGLESESSTVCGDDDEGDWGGYEGAKF